MSIWLKPRIFGAIFLAGLLFASAPALSAQKKISELPALTGANIATDDDFLVVDTDVTTSKRITRDELAIGLGGSMGIVVESAPGIAPTATGTDALGMGDGAVAGNAAADDGVLAIGARSTATGDGAIAIGENSDSTGTTSIAIGGSVTDASSADATSNNAIAIGGNSLASNVDSIGIGASAVGSGNSGVAIGAVAIASANRTIAIGRNVDATGANCTAIGGNVTDTDSADCSAADAVAIGQHVLADDIGEFAFASGEFATQSDAHTSIYVLRNQTTDATQTELFSDASAGDISVPSDCTTVARISIVARQANEDGTSAMYFIVVGLDNNAGTTAVLTAATVTTIFEDTNASAWDVTATADDTNDGINVLVTGAASDNINWVARAEVVESCG